MVWARTVRRLRFSGYSRSVLVKLLVASVGLQSSHSAYAGNWGESWGDLLWGRAVAPLQAIPVDSLWMLIATSLVLMVLGSRKMR